jgi:hypothetical protein
MGFYFKAVLIAACIGVAAPAYAQVRVITGGIEHVYGTGGQLLDDDALRAQNERAERELQVKRDKAARQEQADAESKRQKALADQAAAARALGTR